MTFEYLFFAFLAFALGSLAWRYFRSGSFTGAMLGGRIARDVGEIVVAKSATSSTVLRVHIVEPARGDAFVGLAVVSKAPLAASMLPVQLSKAQARQLVALLTQASA